MKFGPVPLSEASGVILAHAVKQGDVVIKKGTVLNAAHIERLKAAGVATIVAARIDPDDMGENEAALALAQSLAGDGIRVEAPATGRSNLFAEVAGVLTIDAALVDALNGVDEAVTVATLPQAKAVVAGEMVATVKIIPFAVPAGLVQRVQAEVTGPGIAVAPFQAKSVAVISTVLPGLKPTVIDKTVRVMGERLKPAGAKVVADRRVDHTEAALRAALVEPETRASDLIIVFGASAITDRLDVIPAALTAAGGRIEHFGMPVDPGNLLLVGELGGKPVLGAPGCARSPRENGFDWVLHRLLADIPVRRQDIQRMGVGGLLMEIVSRPQPRVAEVALPASSDTPRLAVLVLAAGRSTRMGAENKLLAIHEGRPLVRHVVDVALAAEVGPVIVVTGHQQPEVSAALAGTDVRIVQNPDFAKGLSTSLQAGIAALPETVDGAIVALGDMPLITPALLRRLAGSFREHGEVGAVVPTMLGERGNPVLLARSMFTRVATLTGDVGARKLIDAAGDAVVELPVDDPGIHRDIDTPEALSALRAGQ